MENGLCPTCIWELPEVPVVAVGGDTSARGNGPFAAGLVCKNKYNMKSVKLRNFFVTFAALENSLAR